MGLPATGLLFPLAIRNEENSFTVRTILAVNEADNWITFAGDIPQGSFALLMRTNLATTGVDTTHGRRNRRGHGWLAVRSKFNRILFLWGAFAVGEWSL